MGGHTGTQWFSAVATSAHLTSSTTFTSEAPVSQTLIGEATVIINHSPVFCSFIYLVIPQGFELKSFGMTFSLHFCLFFCYPMTEYDEVTFSGSLAQDLNP